MSITNPTAAVPEWTLGWRLQRALAHADMTTAEMAAELDVTRSTISRWVNDHGAPPRAGFVKLWALRTGVPAEWLLTGQDPTSPDDPAGLGIPPTAWKAESGRVVPLCLAS